MQRTRAHPARAPAGFSSAASPRHRGPRLGGILPQKQKQQLALFGSCAKPGCTRTNSRRSLPSINFAQMKCARLLLRQDAAEMGPLWRGERVEEKPEGARAGCARGRCAHMDVRSATPGTRSRSRRAGCPETAPPGVCFFGYFLCTSKESDPLAAGEWKLCTCKRETEDKIKMDSRFRGNDVQ